MWLKLRFAARNLIRNRRRSLVTLSVASVGSAAILLGGGFTLFTYESLSEFAARDTGHLTLAQSRFFEEEEEKPMQHGIDRHQELAESLRKNPEVRAVLPRVQFSGLLSNGEKSSIFAGMGVDPIGEFRVKGPMLKVLSGELLRGETSSSGLPEVVLGGDLARGLKAAPGSILTLLTTTTEGSLNGLDVEVRGTITLGIPELDRRIVFVSVGTAQKALRSDRVSSLAVHLRATEQTDPVGARIGATLEKGQALRTWLDQAFYYRAVRGLYDRIFGLLGLIILVLVFFAVSNTISMAVSERTREVGTLRAMGASPGELVLDFALEGALIGVLGALIGTWVSAGLSIFFALADLQMPPPPGHSQGYPLSVTLSPELAAGTAVLVVAVCAAAAWLSSRASVRKPIVEALNHV